MFAKLSILLLFVRISPGRNFRILTWVFFITVMASSLALFLANLLSCLTIVRDWTTISSANQCNIDGKFLKATSGVNIATDVVLLLLPLPIVRTIALPFKQKVGLGLILATGSFVCIISILRLHFSLATFTSPDPAWSSVDLLIWT